MNGQNPSPYRLEHIRSAIGHYLLGRGAAAVAGLASAVLLVRHMQVQEYAGYTAVMGLTGIVSMLASLGLERVVARFVPEARLGNHALLLRRFAWRLACARLIVTGILTLLLGASWPWVVRSFDFITLHAMPPALAVYLLAAATSSFMTSVLQALVHQRLLTRLNVLQWGGRLGWILWIVWQGEALDLPQVLWILALTELATAAILCHATYSATRTFLPTSEIAPSNCRWPDWSEVRQLGKHSFGFNILASIPQGYFMRTLIAATLPIDTVAAYGFFSSLIDRLRMYLPMQLMYGLIEPVIVARYLETRDSKSLNRNVELAYKINIIVLALVLIVFAIGGATLISLLTKGRFIDQTWIVILLIVQIVSGSQVLAVQLILNVFKANYILSWSGFIAVIVLLIFLVASVASNHPEWIIFGTLLYSVTLNLFLRLGIKRGGVPYEAHLRQSLGIILIAAIVSCGAHHILSLRGGLSLIETSGAIVLSMGSFLALVGITGLLTKQEVAILIGTVRARAMPR